MWMEFVENCSHCRSKCEIKSRNMIRADDISWRRNEARPQDEKHFSAFEASRKLNSLFPLQPSL